MRAEDKIKYLLANPNMLIQKKPFTRGADLPIGGYRNHGRIGLNETDEAELPNFKKRRISQSQFLRELDPDCHKVLFDENIPKITMKTKDDNYVEIEYKRMAIPFQKNIKDKHVLHLCGNPMQFTLMDTEPNEKTKQNFITFKQYWQLRNQDGMKTKMIDVQKSVGDCGLLYYMDYKGRVKSRIISYMDGYAICSHNDNNGDRIMESVYYIDREGNDRIDSYDDKYMYRHVRKDNVYPDDSSEWELVSKSEHGFSEIPLITKRGEVAWNDVQSIIEVYEVLYNVFIVIQKRHGWGILYIKGRINDTIKKLNGSIVLQDTTMDGNGSAEFKSPPNPQGTIETLEILEEAIQKGSGTTFLMPKDVKTSGDVSGIAIMLTQSRDIEKALQGAIEWQNVVSKMCRLFKEGLAKELVYKDINPTAVTDFKEMNIHAELKIWIPRSETEYNNMLIALHGGKLISTETGIESNTASKPDEVQRLEKQNKEEREYEAEIETRKAQQTIIDNNKIDGEE